MYKLSICIQWSCTCSLRMTLQPTTSTMLNPCSYVLRATPHSLVLGAHPRPLCSGRQKNVAIALIATCVDFDQIPDYDSISFILGESVVGHDSSLNSLNIAIIVGVKRLSEILCQFWAHNSAIVCRPECS